MKTNQNLFGDIDGIGTDGRSRRRQRTKAKQIWNFGVLDFGVFRFLGYKTRKKRNRNTKYIDTENEWSQSQRTSTREHTEN